MIASRIAAVLAALAVIGCIDGASSPIASSDASTEATTSGLADLGEGGIVDDGYEVDSGADGCAFACPDPSAPPGSGDDSCDTWSQDCASGLKCMPWANDGGGSWNATRCSPLDPLPALIGAPCTVEGSGVSGIDDCELGAMCWDVDPETNTGTCVGMCLGSESSPLCTDPTLTCVISNEGVLALCLPACDPLAQDCSRGKGCYSFGDNVACAPDESGDGGALGEPCVYVNACDPGLVCTSTTAAECPSGACCASWCDVGEPEPTESCEVGQVCAAVNRNGQGPPELQHVGICVMPE
jgi:hypothetical protein